MRIPAPSPVSGSLPLAPRWSRLRSTVEGLGHRVVECAARTGRRQSRRRRRRARCSGRRTAPGFPVIPAGGGRRHRLSRRLVRLTRVLACVRSGRRWPPPGRHGEPPRQSGSSGCRPEITADCQLPVHTCPLARMPKRRRLRQGRPGPGRAGRPRRRSLVRPPVRGSGAGSRAPRRSRQAPSSSRLTRSPNRCGAKPTAQRLGAAYLSLTA